MAMVAPFISLGSSQSASFEADKKHPNIILVDCHDLGDFLHCSGMPTVQTPHLDALAASGVRFSRSFCSAPQCSPSRASLFTGRYPHSNGVMGLTHANFAWDLHPEERHLAQYLQEVGYTTAAFGHIHETRSKAERIGIQKHFPDARVQNCMDSAIDWLKEWSAAFPQGKRGKPFYLQFGIIEPHRLGKSDPRLDSSFLPPGVEPDETLGVTIPGYLLDNDGSHREVAELQGAIRYMDAQVGRLFKMLDELNLTENTLVLFTADHGVALPRAKCAVYDPGLQVCLILRWPRGGLTGGKVLDSMISNIDVLPTLLELLEIPTPESLQGRSFYPLLMGNPYQPRREIFGEITYHDYYDPRRAIRTETHKLILNFSAAPFFMDPSQSWRPRSDTVFPLNHAFAYHPHVELYDLQTDPWELNNLAESASHAEIRQELMTRLKENLIATSDPILKGAVTSPMHRKVLEILERNETNK